MRLRTLVLGAAISAFSFAGSLQVSAAPVVTTTPLTYYNYDTRPQGSFAPSVTPTSPDGDGSLQMQTLDGSSAGKTSVVWLASPGAPQLGTLGTLTGVSYDYYKASSPTTSAPTNFAVRVWLNQVGTQCLVYENDYNGSGTIATDVWHDNFQMVSGNFWERGNGANFNGAGQAQTLAAWEAGYSQTTDGNGAAANSVVLSPTTPVYGVEVSYGSGIAPFTGYVDDVRLDFGANDYKGNVAAVTPEPASLAFLAGLGTLAVRRRRAA